MKLPWPVLRQMLELFQRGTTVEEYARMARDGDNIFDILPGNVLRRTPVPNEMYGTASAEFGNFTGELGRPRGPYPSLFDPAFVSQIYTGGRIDLLALRWRL